MKHEQSFRLSIIHHKFVYTKTAHLSCGRTVCQLPYGTRTEMSSLKTSRCFSRWGTAAARSCWRWCPPERPLAVSPAHVSSGQPPSARSPVFWRCDVRVMMWRQTRDMTASRLIPSEGSPDIWWYGVTSEWRQKWHDATFRPWKDASWLGNDSYYLKKKHWQFARKWCFN